jgi:hypothetical protein
MDVGGSDYHYGSYYDANKLFVGQQLYVCQQKNRTHELYWFAGVSTLPLYFSTRHDRFVLSFLDSLSVPFTQEK